MSHAELRVMPSGLVERLMLIRETKEAYFNSQDKLNAD